MPAPTLEALAPDDILAAFAHRIGIEKGEWKLTVRFANGAPRAHYLEAGPMRGGEFRELTELLHAYAEGHRAAEERERAERDRDADV
jgi:hypothetical protein